MKKRYFPCPICKGRGDFNDADFVDVGFGLAQGVQVSSATECGWCEGNGMVEINGEIHMKRKYEKAGWKLMNEDREYSNEEIIAMGKAHLASQKQHPATFGDK